jgi:integrase
MSRTANVIQRGSTWSIRYRAWDPARGEVRQIMKGGYRTKREAVDALNEVHGQIKEGTYAQPSKDTLKDYLEGTWFPSLDAAVLGGDLKVSAAQYYKDAATVRIIPRLGGVKLQSIDAAMLERFYGDLLQSGRKDGKGGLSRSTVHGCHVTLSRALGDAVRWRLLSRNVAKDANSPVADKKEQEVWSAAQVRTFLAAVKDDRLSAMWHLVLSTGLRRGELAGLTWQDVNLEAGVLTVRSNRVVINHQIHVGTPKSEKSKRRIGLDAGTVQALRDHYARVEIGDKLEAESGWQGEGHLFVDEIGRPIHPNVITRLWKRAAAKAGLPVIKLHSARHSYATAGLEAGVPLKVMSERLGHSTYAITADTYSHVSTAVDQDAADRIAEYLFGTS